MNTHAEPIAELRNVRKTFSLPGGTPLSVLEDISLSVQPGEIIALLGPSGSGKSTLMRILTGLIEPSGGDVLAYGEPLRGLHPKTAIVFQNFALFPWLTVRQNIAMGLLRMDLSEADRARRVDAAVDKVGLEGFEGSYPKELSGGMKQRVGIARAIAVQPDLLCMDEPFSALDVLTAENLRAEVLKLWLDRSVEIRAILIVTHDIREAVSLANRIVVLGSHPGTIRMILANDLQHPRDPRSEGFQAMMDRIHDVITQTILPDRAAPPPDIRTRPVEPLPRVLPGQVIGLLQILTGHGGRIDAFDLALQIGKDFGTTLGVVRAAELLGFVDTPGQDVVVTEAGRAFLAAPLNDRKNLFRERIRSLRLFEIVVGSLERAGGSRLDGDVLLEQLAILLPNEEPEAILETLIAWGRFGELLGYDVEERVLFLEKANAPPPPRAPETD